MESQTRVRAPSQAIINQLLREIDDLAHLFANWDGESALPISQSAIAIARDLVSQVFNEAHQSGLAWREPTVSPTRDGGITLSWEVGDRWTMLTVEDDPTRIGCLRQQNGAEPHQGIESSGDALRAALWVSDDGWLRCGAGEEPWQTIPISRREDGSNGRSFPQVILIALVAGWPLRGAQRGTTPMNHQAARTRAAGGRPATG